METSVFAVSKFAPDVHLTVFRQAVDPLRSVVPLTFLHLTILSKNTHSFDGAAVLGNLLILADPIAESMISSGARPPSTSLATVACCPPPLSLQGNKECTLGVTVTIILVEFRGPRSAPKTQSEHWCLGFYVPVDFRLHAHECSVIFYRIRQN